MSENISNTEKVNNFIKTYIDDLDLMDNITNQIKENELKDLENFQ
jgi:hypothetical protein